MSRLEKFIDNNRDAFDDMVPPDKVWSQVEAAVNKTNRQNILLMPFMKWTAAAAALIIAATATFFTEEKKNSAETLAVSSVDTITSIAAVPVEEAPEMNHFAALIAVKQEELKVLAKEQPKLYQKFAKDITQLDSSYNSLKSALSVTPNRELLIEAMIQNLQLQLNILNQQLNIIQQIKQSKQPGHEKNKSFT